MALADQLADGVADPVDAVGGDVAVGPHHQQPGAAKVLARNSSSSREASSAACRSSMTSTSGRSAAACRRAPGDGLEDGEAPPPTGAREPAGARSSPGARPGRAPAGRAAAPAPSQAARARSSRSSARTRIAWAHGQNGGAPRLPAADPEHLGASLVGRVVGQVLRQPGLADPGLARDQQQPDPSAERVLEAGRQLGQLPVAAHERPPRSPTGRSLLLEHRANQPNPRPPHPEHPTPHAPPFAAMNARRTSG